jgi:tetratricopeptide (TPR) repeat protein
LREAFVARGGRTRRPMKQPGTPMLTLDGKIILDRDRLGEPQRKEGFDDIEADSRRKSRFASSTDEEEREPRQTSAPFEPAFALARGESDTTELRRKESVKTELDARSLQTPLEDLLARKPSRRETPISPDESMALVPYSGAPFIDSGGPPAESTPDAETSVETPFEEPDASDETPLAMRSVNFESGPPRDDEPLSAEAADDFVNLMSPDKPAAAEPRAGMIDISFEDLFAGGSILEEQLAPMTGSENPAAMDLAPVDDLSQPEDLPTADASADEAASFFAVDEVLRQELESHYDSSTTMMADESEEMAAHDQQEDQTPAAQLAEMDLPYVDVREILEQNEADGGVHFVDGNTVEENGNSPQDHVSPGVEADYSRRRREPATPLRPGVTAERKTDGPNGLGPVRRREDERERLLIAGLRHYKNQRFQEAIAEFESAIRLYPDFKEAFSILGNAYFRNRMYDAAAKAYTRVKEMDPYDTTAYENMGVIFANRGEYMEAMKEWQRVLEIDPGRDDIRRKIERASRMLMRKAAV